MVKLMLYILLKMNVITSYGDKVIKLKDNGLYSENQKYVYKGKEPNNYILFNNEIWRIISFENENMKIIKEESIGKKQYSVEQNNNFRVSTLKSYLNNEYYNSIKPKELIQTNYFNIEEYSTDENIHKQHQIKLNIGLLSLEEYLDANSNSKCQALDDYNNDKNMCQKTNYFNSFIKTTSWTITSDNSAPNIVVTIDKYYFGDSEVSYYFDVYPVMYLKKEINLEGEGTKNNPYRIINA